MYLILFNIPRVSPEVGKNQNSLGTFCGVYNNNGILNIAVEHKMSAAILVIAFYVTMLECWEAIRFLVIIVAVV